jgi:hypothetical protein
MEVPPGLVFAKEKLGNKCDAELLSLTAHAVVLLMLKDVPCVRRLWECLLSKR